MSDNQGDPMTREQAVAALVSVWYQCDGEFCVTQAEKEASVRELHEALRTLGVTDEEMA